MMELKNEDMVKMEKAFFNNLCRNDGEYGGIGLDSKRPFGNSGVATDILEDILEMRTECVHCGRGTDDGYSEEQIAYADALYENLIPWLQGRYGSLKK